MGAVTVETSLTATAGGALQDVVDVKVEALRALFQKYVSGAGEVVKGILPIGDEDMPMPNVQIQGRRLDPKMITTGKYQTRFLFDFVYYQGDDNAEAAVAKATSLAVIFRKLFSNDALNDASAARTNQFKLYSPHWIDSEMSRVEISPLFKFWKDRGPKYVAMGYFQLDALTVELV